MNRRILRSKALQGIFAYEHQCLASVSLGLSEIAKAFYQERYEKGLSYDNKERERKCLELFADYCDKDSVPNEMGEVDMLIIKEAIASYKNDTQSLYGYIKKQMLQDMENLPSMFTKVLSFFKHVLNKALFSEIKKGVYNYPFFADMIEKLKAMPLSEEEKDIMSNMMPPLPKKQVDNVYYYVSKIVFNNKPLMDYYADMDIRWHTNQRILSHHFRKMIELEEIKWQIVKEEDKKFMMLLFEKSLENKEVYEKKIEAEATNWDIDRITNIDRILLVMGMAEAEHLPDIPKRVTINEFIELSKIYGTPNSYVFVNGMLHKLIS